MSMEDFEERIGKIEYADIIIEDHGFLSVHVGFDYGSSHQGIPLRVFGLSGEKDEDFEKWRLGHEMGMDFIRRFLELCAVDKWSAVKGRTLLVTASWTDIASLKPLPTERGIPFDMKEWAAKYDDLVPSS